MTEEIKKEPTGILCLGGPMHMKKHVAAEEGFSFEMDETDEYGKGRHCYRWIKMALDDNKILELYVFDGTEFEEEEEV